MIGGGSAFQRRIVTSALFNTARTGNALIDEATSCAAKADVIHAGDNARIDVRRGNADRVDPADDIRPQRAAVRR